MNYSDKLKDPRWQKLRLEILGRDEFTCQLCNDTETELHVHHFSYPDSHNPWDAPTHSLITYCKHCHAVVEFYKNSDLTPLDILKIELENNKIQVFVFNSENNDIDLFKYHEKENLLLYSSTFSESTINALFEYQKKRNDFFEKIESRKIDNNG